MGSDRVVRIPGAPASIGVALSDQLESASPQSRSILTIAVVVGIVVSKRILRK
jgi:hypothetical protein